MNQNIVTYLQDNKDLFSKEVLVDQLKKAGYEEGDIAGGVACVYDAAASSDQTAQQGGFLDFKSIKTYVNSSDKWKDFLFGFFAPFLCGLLLAIVPILGSLVFLAAYVFFLVYFFKRRRFIFYGMLAELVLMPLVVIVLYFIIFGYGFF
jgi:hypothetical protein